MSTGKGGALEVVKNTLREKGPFGFYRGLSSMIYFATPKAAIRFSSFEVCLSETCRVLAPHTDSHIAVKTNVADIFSAYMMQTANSAMRTADGKPMFGGMTSFLAGLAAGTAEAIFVTTPQVLLHPAINRFFPLAAPLSTLSAAQFHFLSSQPLPMSDAISLLGLLMHFQNSFPPFKDQSVPSTNARRKQSKSS